MVNPNILIVGSKSKIAKAFCQYERDLRITTASRSIYGSDLYLDLADNPLLPPDLNVETAIIFSSVTNINYCESFRSYATRVNISGTLSLISSLLDKGIKVIFLSSSAVFSNSSDDHYELSPKSPDSFYGLTKHVIEEVFASHPLFHCSRLTKVISPCDFVYQSILKIYQGCEVQALVDFFLAPLSMQTTVAHLSMLVSNFLPGVSHLSPNSSISYFELLLNICHILNLDYSLLERAHSNGVHSFNPRFPTLSARHSSSSICLLHSIIREVSSEISCTL